MNDLGKYYKFFQRNLRRTLQSCLDQNIFVVELRHISGILFDDNKQSIPFAEELKIISDIVDEMKKQVPYFELKLIITGLKIVGHKHVAKMMSHIEEGRKLGNLITGFDLVNEEDFTDHIGEFAPDYYA